MSLDVITKLKTCPKIKSVTVTENKKLVIKWTEVEGAEKYGVKRAASDNGEFEHIAWCKKLSFTDENVEENVTYRYKIMAYKKLEGKKSSTKLSAVRAAVISDIPAPENLEAQAEKGPSVSLRWEKCKDADSYIVNRRNDFYSQILPIARTTENHFSDDKVVYGQPCHYSVQPVINTPDGEKQGNFSKEVHAVCIDKGQIISAAANFGKRINLVVRIVTGADCYCIERSEKEEGPFEQIYTTSDALEYRITDKVPYAMHTYYYRMRAMKKVSGEVFYGKYCKTVRIKSK